MAGSIDMEQKGCESIGCYTFFVTLSYMTLTLDFQGQILEMLCLGNVSFTDLGAEGCRRSLNALFLM